MFSRFWLLHRCSFSVALWLCLFIGRTIAGWACFFSFWLLGRHSFSVSLPICLFIGRTFAGCACFCAFGSSVCAPLAFPCLLLIYWPHVCWLCMFLCIWLLRRCSFSVSLPLCLVIGRTFAGRACFCTFGCSVGTPLALPYRFTCLFDAHLLVGPVFALLFAR